MLLDGLADVFGHVIACFRRFPLRRKLIRMTNTTLTPVEIKPGHRVRNGSPLAPLAIGGIAAGFTFRALNPGDE
jgi:hypothetical protein